MAGKKSKVEALEHLMQKSQAISKELVEFITELQKIAEEVQQTESFQLKEPAKVFHEHDLRASHTHQADRLLRLKEVLDILPVSKSSFWAGIKTGRYPKPTYTLGAKTPTWALSSIMHFVDGEVANR